MKTKTVQWTIGPVQGFVAQARRTRDLYAGSFLLSYLAGWAMWAVLQAAGGEVVFPVVTDGAGHISDPLLAAIRAVATGDAVRGGPSLGTLPNRFRACVPGSFDPGECYRAVMDAWRRVCNEVWDAFVAPVVSLGHGVRTIWDRQVSNFWDVTWVVGEDHGLLDRRKNWRVFVPGAEPGDKCTVMGTLQELSGFVRSRGGTEREKQDLFWQALRSGIKDLDLRKDERLCAVSLVKRLYPRVAKAAVGWDLPVHYPSTSYIAAVPWIREVMEAEPEALPEFVDSAGGVSTTKGSRIMFPDLVRAARQHPGSAALADLDGNCFFRNALENDRLWEEGTSPLRRSMVQKLEKLCRDPASPFYAVLLMDGDRLGALLGEHGGPRVSRALADFGGRVAGLVESNNGVTVYAGGDDVLALFPLPYALRAAWRLREAYGQAFRQEFGADTLGPNDGTVSAAVLFAQYHLPLKAVLAETHRLLDEVAKDHTGRDSLAVAVWKGAGRTVTCSWPWEALREGERDLLGDLVERFSGGSKQEKELNSTFFYNARTLFDLLRDSLPGEDQQLQEDLLTAEYVRNRERLVTVAEARERVARLLRLCRRSWRDAGGLHIAEGPLSFDGSMLVRFLAGRGIAE